jgi:predicted enzyme related to lactoylglutathione lyase
MTVGKMSLRLELFVQDMERSVNFYCRVLGFEILRSSSDYARLHNGSVILGLGPIGKLAEQEGYFTRTQLTVQEHGLGVEIVFEVKDVRAMYEQVQTVGYAIFEPLQQQPWGLEDFRIVDPDGYYLRITSHGER